MIFLQKYFGKVYKQLYAFSFTQKYTKIVVYFPNTYYIYEEVFNIKDLIPLKKACSIIGVSYKTIYSWVSNNEVSYTKIGNRYYMTQEQLNALVFVFTKDYTQASK